MSDASLSSLLRQYEEQFGVVSADLVSKIGEIKSSPSRSRVLEDEAEVLLQDAKDILEQVGLEIRSLNGVEKQKWINRSKSYHAELKRVIRELKLALNEPVDEETSREQLFGAALNSDQKQKLLSSVDKAEESSRHLNQGFAALQETHEIGAKILADLDGQRETLLRSQHKMRGMNSDLDESSRVAGRMIQRVNQNKAVLLAVLGTFCLAVTGIIYVASTR
ncbi:unnamed protein product [Notodromas monacha]|uniref:Vesicle transport v-SNARE N-terminal domain-containing protein n=1 Tax=Notodromas monacha TaxID=399045 RepID=A0A7R9GF24_9CRUS|nr:unnamed protein product [Notodromas monacha]CAG0920247.1 unnamed protein product [Notodromas monacha]